MTAARRLLASSNPHPDTCRAGFLDVRWRVKTALSLPLSKMAPWPNRSGALCEREFLLCMQLLAMRCGTGAPRLSRGQHAFARLDADRDGWVQPAEFFSYDGLAVAHEALWGEAACGSGGAHPEPPRAAASPARLMLRAPLEVEGSTEAHAAAALAAAREAKLLEEVARLEGQLAAARAVGGVAATPPAVSCVADRPAENDTEAGAGLQANTGWHNEVPAAERRAKVTALESELASDAAASRVQAVVRGRKGRAAAAAMVRARVEAGAVTRVQARVRGRNGRAAVAAAADTAAAQAAAQDSSVTPLQDALRTRPLAATAAVSEAVAVAYKGTVAAQSQAAEHGRVSRARSASGKVSQPCTPLGPDLNVCQPLCRPSLHAPGTSAPPAELNDRPLVRQQSWIQGTHIEPAQPSSPAADEHRAQEASATHLRAAVRGRCQQPQQREDEISATQLQAAERGRREGRRQRNRQAAKDAEAADPAVHQANSVAASEAMADTKSEQASRQAELLRSVAALEGQLDSQLAASEAPAAGAVPASHTAVGAKAAKLDRGQLWSEGTAFQDEFAHPQRKATPRRAANSSAADCDANGSDDVNMGSADVDVATEEAVTRMQTVGRQQSLTQAGSSQPAGCVRRQSSIGASYEVLDEAVLRAQSVSRSRRAPAPACKEARDGSVCEAAAVLNAVQAAVRAAERPTPLAEATVHGRGAAAAEAQVLAESVATAREEKLLREVARLGGQLVAARRAEGRAEAAVRRADAAAPLHYSNSPSLRDS